MWRPVEAEARRKLADAALEAIDGVSEWWDGPDRSVFHRVNFRLEQMVHRAREAYFIDHPGPVGFPTGVRTAYPDDAGRLARLASKGTTIHLLPVRKAAP